MTDSEKIQALQDEANRLRVHCIRMTTKAGSGHPTTCLSAAEIAACLFFEAGQDKRIAGSVAHFRGNEAMRVMGLARVTYEVDRGLRKHGNPSLQI